MTLLCFIATGNYLRRVSCSTWHHCVSYRQETICEGFPIRLGTTVFLADRKLFAKGFLFDMALLCFLPAGNCSRKVSYSAWQHCVSLQQETFCEWFPVRHGTIVFQCDRKLFAKGFLVVMAPLCFLPAGNYLRMVSCSTWHHCVSMRQETICEGFPVRHDTTVFQRDKKLFAKGFLVDMALLCFFPTGNYSPGDFSTPLSTLEMTGAAWQQWDFLRRSAVSRQRIADKADHKKRNPPA